MSAKAEETRVTNAEWQERKLAAMARGQGNIAPVYIERGLNAELWDVEGNRYVDFGTGIAVCNTGHSNPRVVAAVKEQVERFSHTCVMVTPYDTAVRLAHDFLFRPGLTNAFDQCFEFFARVEKRCLDLASHSFPMLVSKLGKRLVFFVIGGDQFV